MTSILDTTIGLTPALKYSTFLTHMTSDFPSLKLILESGFKYSYCKEYYSDNTKTITASFPMISLSDMYCTDAITSLRSYGTYAITMKMEWAQRNGFNPVLYLEKNSDIASEYIAAFDRVKVYSTDQLYEAFKNPKKIEEEYLRAMIKFFAYTKNYSAPLIRGNRIVFDNYMFGLEREWRKVCLDDGVRPFILGSEKKCKKCLNKELGDRFLEFGVEDIEAILIEDDDLKADVEEIIKKKYGLSTFPGTIKFIYNNIRYRPDEG